MFSTRQKKFLPFKNASYLGYIYASFQIEQQDNFFLIY